MEKKDRKKYIVIALIVVLAAAAFGWYSYNLPARRLERALKKADALLVNEKRTLDAATARFLHTAPVAERIRNQVIRRNYRNRIVPVAHFHRRKRNVNDRTISMVAFNFNPVALAQEVR